MADEQAGVCDEFVDIPVSEDAAWGFAEREDFGDDFFQLVDLFADDLLVLISRVAVRVLKIQ